MLVQILQLLQEILTILKEISTHLIKFNGADTTSCDELLDNSDVKRMLKVTDSTLYRWRKQELIVARRIGKKDYYQRVDLERLLKNEMGRRSK
jgi:hypothetical protein